MMNYIKSEFYRISHSKSTYLATMVLAGLALLLHIALYSFGGRYATVSFSYSSFVSNPMVFGIMGSIVALFLYEGNRKNGNLKNTISSGISRIKIFISECIVSAITATVIMIVVLAVWIISAEFVLDKSGPVVLADLLMEVPVVYLIAIACLISSIVFLELFEKTVVAIVLWYAIWFIIPQALGYLGLRFDMIYEIAMWLPSNIFNINQQHVNMRECITVWDTTEGIVRCILSGGFWVSVFTLLGLLSLRKRDL